MSFILIIGSLKGIPLLTRIAKKNMKNISNPPVIPNEIDVIVFSDVAFRIADSRESFGFTLNSKRNIMFAGAIQGPKVFSFKEAEARAIFLTLIKAEERDFLKACILPMSKNWFKL